MKCKMFGPSQETTNAYMLPGPARSSIDFFIGELYPVLDVKQASNSSSTCASSGFRMTKQSGTAALSGSRIASAC